MSAWDLKQKKSFTKAMGKKRARFARGGRVPKQDPHSRVADLLEQHGETLQKFADGSYVQALNSPGVSQADTGPRSSAPTTVAPNNMIGDFGKGYMDYAKHFYTGDWGKAPQDIQEMLNPLLNSSQNQFQATAAPIQQGTNADQLNQGYTDAIGGLGAQNQFMNQLAGQNGIQNQTDVYNQMQNIAQGRGPNPAQAMLNQATGANVSNQAALMAGQRGSAANAGLIARQAAQTGAGIQQNSAGQGATMQANQSLDAQNQLAGIAQNQVNQQGQAITGYNTAAQNEQNTLQNANTSYNNAQVGMQSNLNNVNGQISQGNQSAKNGMLGGIMNGGSSMLSSFMAKGGEVGSANVGTGSYISSNSSSGPSIGSMGTSPDMGVALKDAINTPKKKKSPSEDTVVTATGTGNGGVGAGSARISSAIFADGGEVSDNVGTANVGSGNYIPSSSGPAPSIGSMAAPPSDGGGGGGAGIGSLLGLLALAAHGGEVPHHERLHNYFSDGGKVPAMVSPGEVYLSPEKVRQVVEEGKNPMKIGQHFKGKAKKKNDSYANDTVPMTLEEGGVVIPRHITTHKMSAEKAELFVHRAIARKKARK